MLNVIWVKLKDYRQSLPMIGVMTGLALVLIYIFGISFQGTALTKAVVVDNDNSAASQEMLSSLDALGGFEYSAGSFEVGLESVKDGQTIAVVVIHDGFEAGLLNGTAQVTVYDAGASIEVYTLKSNLSSVGRRLGMEELFLHEMSLADSTTGSETLRERLRDQVSQYPLVRIMSSTYDGSAVVAYDGLKHSFIGYILFFSMFTMVFGIGSIVDEKENQVWQRQAVAPIGMSKVLAGNMIAAYIVGMCQLMLMMIISKFIFGIDLGGSLVALLLVLSCYVIAVTCLGLLMSGMVQTMQQLGAFSPIVIVSTSMIGGCMWPLEIITSKVLLVLADFTPQRWAYKGMKTIIVQGGGMADVLEANGYLLLIAVVLFGISLIKYMKIPNVQKG